MAYVIAESVEYAGQIYIKGFPIYPTLEEAHKAWSNYPLLQRKKYYIYNMIRESHDHDQCQGNCGQCERRW